MSGCDGRTLTKDRLEVAKYFYSNASEAFTKIVAAIENEEIPFVPEYDEFEERPFLAENLINFEEVAYGPAKIRPKCNQHD